MSNVVKAAALATALAYVANPVSAQEVRNVVFGGTPEEIIVKALDLSGDVPAEVITEFRVGLTQVFLKHEYDEDTDTWIYQEPPVIEQDN